MDLVLVLMIAALVIFVVYLLQVSATPPQTIVVLPSTMEREPGIGCAPVVLAILLGLLVVVILGGLPTIG